MLVKRLMDQHPVTVHPQTTVTAAQRLMYETKAFHLPVVDDKKRLQGLINQQTILIEPEALGSVNVWELTSYLSHLKVKEVMIRKENVAIVAPDTTFEDAADLMVKKGVGCLIKPVKIQVA